MSLHCPRSGLFPLPLLSTPSLSLGCLGFLLILILGRTAHRNTSSFSPGELLYGPLFSLSFRWPGSPYQTALTLIWASQERDSALNRTFKRFATTGLLCFPVRVACFKPSRKLLSPHLGTAGFFPSWSTQMVFIWRVSLRAHLLRGQFEDSRYPRLQFLLLVTLCNYLLRRSCSEIGWMFQWTIFHYNVWVEDSDLFSPTSF